MAKNVRSKIPHQSGDNKYSMVVSSNDIQSVDKHYVAHVWAKVTRVVVPLLILRLTQKIAVNGPKVAALLFFDMTDTDSPKNVAIEVDADKYYLEISTSQ